MAVLTITEQPPKFCSAYKPMDVVVTSLRYPVNQMPGERVSVLEVRAAVLDDLITYPLLQVGEVFVRHASVTDLFLKGQTILLSNQVPTDYNGVFRVRRYISDTMCVIDCEDFGTSSTGEIYKHYENYALSVVVEMRAGAVTQKRRITNEADGTFVIDVSEYAQRTFLDVFDLAVDDVEHYLVPGEIVPIIADNYIAQGWGLSISEQYNIPDENGVNVLTELGASGAKANLRGKVVVNSVQPYHHIDEETGEPDLQWEDDLTAYELPTLQDGTKRKFLTYCPAQEVQYDRKTAHRVSSDDGAWLAFLWGNPSSDRPYVQLVSYDVNGNQLASPDRRKMTIGDICYLLNIGPLGIGPQLESGVDHYSVEITDSSGNPYTEKFWCRIDDSCKRGTRFFALNSFGSIDPYTLDQGEANEGSIKRTLMERASVARDLNTGGDYMRDVRSVELNRKFSGYTKAENKAMVRYFVNEILESSRVRTRKMTNSRRSYTPVIFLTDRYSIGRSGARVPVEWSYGVDNIKQRR